MLRRGASWSRLILVMMKKIAAIAATVLTAIGLLVAFTQPASATYGNLLRVSGASCTTSGGSDAPDYANILIYKNTEANEGAYYVDLDFKDSNKRKWSWQLFVNANQRGSGVFDLAGTDGTKYISRILVVPKDGTDTIRYKVFNASGTVTCNARVENF